MKVLLTKMRAISPWVVVLVWFAAVALHAWYYVTSILEAGNISEWYARSQSYQLLGFGVARLPIWLCVLGVFFYVRQSIKGKASVVA